MGLTRNFHGKKWGPDIFGGGGGEFAGFFASDPTPLTSVCERARRRNERNIENRRES